MSCQVSPGDTAAYRIAVTRLDQDSAEVLMEIAAYAPDTGQQASRFRAEAEDHWRYSQASTVASGSIEMQRILLARSMLRPPRAPATPGSPARAAASPSLRASRRPAGEAAQ